MIATTVGDAVYIVPKILYVYYETRLTLTTNTHIRWKFYHALCSSIARLYLSLSGFLSLRQSILKHHDSREGRRKIVYDG